MRASKLNRLLERERIYFTDALKCPVLEINRKTGRPKNRSPKWYEISNCLEWLREEMALLKPKIICTLGEIPFKAVFEDSKTTLEWCKPYRYGDITVFPCRFPKRFKRDSPKSIEEFMQVKKLLARL